MYRFLKKYELERPKKIGSSAELVGKKTVISI